MKIKIGIYLDEDVARRFRIAARQPGATKSALVNEALRRSLNPATESRPSGEVLGSLTGLAKRLRQMHREMQVMTETLALFARYFLTVTPPPPEQERHEAELVGRKRYEVLIAEIGRRLASDRNLVSEVIRSIALTDPDLVARAVAEGAIADAGTKPLPFGAMASPTREGHRAWLSR
jgi:hypothetical protein